MDPLTKISWARLSFEQLVGPDADLPEVNATLVYDPVERVFNGRYNATTSGRYFLHVRWNGVDLAGSPYVIQVYPSSAFAFTCTETIDRFPNPNITSRFNIAAVDLWGNRRLVGGDNFFVKVIGPEVGNLSEA